MLESVNSSISREMPGCVCSVVMPPMQAAEHFGVVFAGGGGL